MEQNRKEEILNNLKLKKEFSIKIERASRMKLVSRNFNILGSCMANIDADIIEEKLTNKAIESYSKIALAAIDLIEESGKISIELNCNKEELQVCKEENFDIGYEKEIINREEVFGKMERLFTQTQKKASEDFYNDESIVEFLEDAATLSIEVLGLKHNLMKMNDVAAKELKDLDEKEGKRMLGIIEKEEKENEDNKCN